MRLLFGLFLSLCLASAGALLCGSSREFAVDNCTACPRFDQTRPGNIPMADCEERETDTGGDLAYLCVCRSFPTPAVFSALQYFPQKEGNVTRCAASWATAPQRYTAFSLVSTGVLLYTAAHLFYISLRSKICCCAPHGCTKANASALSFCVATLMWCAIPLWRIVAQGEVPIPIWLAYGPLGLSFCACFWQTIGQVLFYTSISDVAYPGKDKARRRCCISAFFWCLAVMLLPAALYIYKDGMVRGAILALLIMLSGNVFMAIAHKAMHEVVRKHSSSQKKTKPPLIVKMDELCGAICRYFYPGQALGLLCYIAGIAGPLCLYDLSAMSYFSTTNFYLCFVGILQLSFACLLEGKRVPTFPVCWCRRKSPGLQFTSRLGKALELLKKHGLDHKRQEDSPAEVALESLSSTSTLQVAAALDMDLIGCIDYFLDHCAADKGPVPVGQVLRAGDQNVLKVNDIPALRRTMEKCLRWARDPARPPIDNTNFDEAAAIQLYTQETCLYPRLNAALRDHTHPENLKPLLPFLKLLLTGLNKLPLVRARVHRGVRLDLHEQYNQLQGQVFTWWAFSSTTMDLDKIVDNPAFLGSEGDRTLFSIDAIGVDIAAFSAFPNEQELLLLPGTHLTVEPGVNAAPNYWKFEVSVCQADQQKQEEEDEHKVKHGPEARPVPVLTVRDDPSVPKPRFQNTDLVHPGWGGFLQSQ